MESGATFSWFNWCRRLSKDYETVTDMYRYRPIVNQIQEELWEGNPYPPRTIVEVDRLNQDDIFEVEGIFLRAS